MKLYGDWRQLHTVLTSALDGAGGELHASEMLPLVVTGQETGWAPMWYRHEDEKSLPPLGTEPRSSSPQPVTIMTWLAYKIWFIFIAYILWQLEKKCEQVLKSNPKG
jgi:hypothetical protein